MSTRRAPATTWQEVKNEVSRRIETRLWVPGQMIPGETKLAEEFGCARATVNRALRALAEDGVVERKRKAGTRVALHPVSLARFEIPIIRHAITERGSSYGYRLVAREQRPARDTSAEMAGIAPGQRLEHVRAVHLADGAPFVLEDRWINMEAVPDLDAVDFSAVSANEWLLEHVPYSGGALSFAAEAASIEVADLLETEPGAALFVTDRTTYRGKTPITSVKLYYRPGYRMKTAL